MQQQWQIKVADHLARWQTIAITLEKAGRQAAVVGTRTATMATVLNFRHVAPT